MNDLKPCPFCGGEAIIKNLNHKYWNRAIECQHCFCKTGEYNDECHLQAMITDWNRRAALAPTSSSGLVERLRIAAEREDKSAAYYGSNTLANLLREAADALSVREGLVANGIPYAMSKMAERIKWCLRDIAYKAPEQITCAFRSGQIPFPAII